MLDDVDIVLGLCEDELAVLSRFDGDADFELILSSEKYSGFTDSD